PVPDSVFRILESFYSYDRGELKPSTESIDDSSPYWRVEKITFNAAYDRQRVPARLYLPKNAKPPFETIVYFPAGTARWMTHIDDAETKRFDFLIRSGRAVMFPIYMGTYERKATAATGASGERDLTIQQCKDLMRSVDFLETRND